MPRWVVVCVLAALMVLPSRAIAADCAAPGVPGQFDVFALDTFTADAGGTTIQGRVAAGGDARVQGITIGTNPPLAPDAGRADLIVGANLRVDGGGGSVPLGRVTYGGALTPAGTLTARPTRCRRRAQRASRSSPRASSGAARARARGPGRAPRPPGAPPAPSR
jgi:choice-of-anchor A domain-containing protein